jgi:hypothetical protein
MGAQMAFAQTSYREQPAVVLRARHRVTLGLLGITVIFAALGLGEAVYRFAFLDFDGATDRLPIEVLFGMAFAWMTIRVARRTYRYRLETIALIRDRNYRIRHAVETMTPAPYPNNHQAIRVIREEVQRIEGTLAEIMPD